MLGTDWLLIDTETSGLTPPVHAIEIAAQRMRGWDRHGPPFRVLLSHGVEIAPAATRVHGYTQEMLERDGEDPHLAHAALRQYAGRRPISSYNLVFDLDQVLLPEWQRLEVEPVGTRGVCLYRLAQRLLDPVPATNCKLQTLRAYYGLPERQAHSALGDVDTTIDLLQKVLRPLAEANSLEDCPSSNDLRPIGGLCNGVSGPSGFKVRLRFVDASSGDAGWFCA
jgi:DNA polymerase-3 subunit epsilon